MSLALDSRQLHPYVLPIIKFNIVHIFRILFIIVNLFCILHVYISYIRKTLASLPEFIYLLASQLILYRFSLTNIV